MEASLAATGNASACKEMSVQGTLVHWGCIAHVFFIKDIYMRMRVRVHVGSHVVVCINLIWNLFTRTILYAVAWILKIMCVLLFKLTVFCLYTELWLREVASSIEHKLSRKLLVFVKNHFFENYTKFCTGRYVQRYFKLILVWSKDMHVNVIKYVHSEIWLCRFEKLY